MINQLSLTLSLLSLFQMNKEAPQKATLVLLTNHKDVCLKKEDTRRAQALDAETNWYNQLQSIDHKSVYQPCDHCVTWGDDSRDKLVAWFGHAGHYLCHSCWIQLWLANH
jgi:hypothetical protein